MSKKKVNYPRNPKYPLFNKKDPIFGSWFIMKLANTIPSKTQARKLRIVYSAMARFKVKHRLNPALVFGYTCGMLRPIIGARRKRYGKKEFFVPYIINPSRQYKRGVR
jgi:ribosomal protein S7